MRDLKEEYPWCKDEVMREVIDDYHMLLNSDYSRESAIGIVIATELRKRNQMDKQMFGLAHGEGIRVRKLPQ